MSFEKALAGVGQAIDAALAGRTSGATPKAEKAAPKGGSRKKAAAKPKGPSVDDVRDALRRVIEAGGNDGATEVLQNFDAKKVSEVDAEQYVNVIEVCEAYLDDAAANEEDPTA